MMRSILLFTMHQGLIKDIFGLRRLLLVVDGAALGVKSHQTRRLFRVLISSINWHNTTVIELANILLLLIEYFFDFLSVRLHEFGNFPISLLLIVVFVLKSIDDIIN